MSALDRVIKIAEHEKISITAKGSLVYRLLKHDALIDAAKTELTSLRSENERLKGENNNWENGYNKLAERSMREIDKLVSKNARLQKAARNMIDKLNKIQNDSNYIGIFQMANIHGLQYNGENYSKEYDELLAILEEYGKEARNEKDE